MPLVEQAGVCNQTNISWKGKLAPSSLWDRAFVPGPCMDDWYVEDIPDPETGAGVSTEIYAGWCIDRVHRKLGPCRVCGHSWHD